MRRKRKRCRRLNSSPSRSHSLFPHSHSPHDPATPSTTSYFSSFSPAFARMPLLHMPQSIGRSEMLLWAKNLQASCHSDASQASTSLERVDCEAAGQSAGQPPQAWLNAMSQLPADYYRRPPLPRRFAMFQVPPGDSTFYLFVLPRIWSSSTVENRETSRGGDAGCNTVSHGIRAAGHRQRSVVDAPVG